MNGGIGLGGKRIIEYNYRGRAKMPVGFETTKDYVGKRFLWVAPDLTHIAKQLKQRGALNTLKTKWTSTLDMIRAHSPECIVMHIPKQHQEQPDFHSIVMMEELLDSNIQLLPSLDAFDDHAFRRQMKSTKQTVYLTSASCKQKLQPVLENIKEWVSFKDTDDPEFQRVQVGLIMMEDFMTGVLVLTKKLEQKLGIGIGIPPVLSAFFSQENDVEAELVLIVGRLPEMRILDSITQLCDKNLIGSIIACESSTAIMERLAGPDVPFVTLADELDPFGVGVMWREIKRRNSKYYTYVFIGEWSFDTSHQKDIAAKFAKREKEVPSTACVYDALSWWSLHPGQKLDTMATRIMVDPVTTFKSFLSQETTNIEIISKEYADDPDGETYDSDDGREECREECC